MSRSGVRISFPAPLNVQVSEPALIPVRTSVQFHRTSISYLTPAALTGVTRDEIGDRAVADDATRQADDIANGIDCARGILAGGDVAVAAHLLGESPDSVARVSPLR